MMLLTKYFYKEFYPSIFFGLLFFTSLFIISSFFEIAELSLKNGIPLIKATYIIYLSFPFILTSTIPMAVFFGILLSIAKLQSQNEINALYSLGFKKKIFYKETFKIALVFLFIHCIISFVILPKANKNLVQYRIQLLQSGITKAVEPKTFIKTFPKKIIYIKNLFEEKRIWEEIFLVDYTQKELNQYIFAKNGVVYLNKEGNQLWLKIKDSITIGIGEKGKFQKNTAKEQDILLFPPFQKNAIYRVGAREQNLFELYNSFKDPNEYIRNKSKVEFHKRFVLPSLTFLFSFLSLSISLRRREKGAVKGYAVLVSLFVILIAYLLLIYNETLAVEGKINPAFSMWSIPIFFSFWIILAIFLPQKSFFKGLKIKLKKEEKRKKIYSTKSTFNFYLLDFYLLKSFIPWFLFSSLCILSLFIILDFAQIVEDIQKNKPTFYFIFSYYLNAIPQSLYDFIFPISVLVSLGVCISLLEKNREISALKSLGVPIFRIITSLLIFIFSLGIIIFILSETFLPTINQNLDEYKAIITGKKPISKVFRLMGNDFYVATENNWIYQYKAFEKDKKTLLDLKGFFFDKDNSVILEAKEVNFMEDKWFIKEGWERKLINDKIEFKEIKEEIYNMLDSPKVFFDIFDNPNNLNIIKLERYISNLKKAGYKPYKWEIKLWQKLFYPFFLLLIGFVSIVSITYGKSYSHLWGNLAKAFLFGLIYWILVIIFGKIGEIQMLSPFLSAISPNVIAFLLGLYFYFGYEK